MTQEHAIKRAAQAAYEYKGASFIVHESVLFPGSYDYCNSVYAASDMKVTHIAQHWSGNRVQVRSAGARSDWIDF